MNLVPEWYARAQYGNASAHYLEREYNIIVERRTGPGDPGYDPGPAQQPVTAPGYTSDDEVTTAFTGTLFGQSFLNSQAGWCTGFNLTFTDTGATGDVTLALCHTRIGAPDLTRVLAKVTVPVGDLKKHPEKTRFGLQPTFLAPGERYAFVVITGGEHRLAMADKDRFVGGSAFQSADGAWSQGLLENDILFDALFARFPRARYVIDLSAISLAGGITRLDAIAGMIVPDGCEMILEMRPEGSGSWTPLGPVRQVDASLLAGLPGQVHLRAVFLGTADVMPCLQLTGSEMRARRPAIAFTHVSTEITIAAPSNTIVVMADLNEFDSANQSCTIALDVAGSPETADVVEDIVLGAGIRRKATFNLAAPVSAFKITITGTTDTANRMFGVLERIHYSFV